MILKSLGGILHLVEYYLTTLAEIRSTGSATAETSYYTSLETLLNGVGAKLKPKVRAVAQLANTGGGTPDFGLFTANQFQRAKDTRPVEGALPERGVVEVKGWKDNSFKTSKSEQVSKYWAHYGLVLVTNYRDFVLVGRDDSGHPIHLETFCLAESEDKFLQMIAHPRKAAASIGERFLEFLRRVLLSEAVFVKPEELAWLLASYAKEARYRIESASLPALGGLRKALEDALGMSFEGEKGEHFFRATFVQTLFYGIFSSWVLWHRDHLEQSAARFDWRNAAWTLHVPMIASLFAQIATPQRLKPLGIDEVLDCAGAALNRVDRDAFFAKFEEEHAVQYFYEPFLKAYDPQLRKDLGVWYTPPEIVQYQVERVDRVLREELNLPDGLADENVVVLDPCCGTGAYLVETLKRIHKTLEEKGSSALTAQKLKKAAMERVFGFEILPAPFVVSHLQFGLMLRKLNAPLDHDSEQRAGVYLTNALTGWEPLEKPKDELPLFPELMIERDAANKVKQEAPILVILGNPPYNAFAGTSPQEEGGLVDAYKEGLATPINKGGWGIKKFNLDDLYVRFFRIAERRIAKSGKGVVCYISNYSWTSEPSFVVLRKRLLHSFDKFWIENMHGNRKISEYAPDGRTSETIFAIPGFSAGIQQGVVISLWMRSGGQKESRENHIHVRYRDDIDEARAVERRKQLLDSLNIKHFNMNYEIANPSHKNRYSFLPIVFQYDYLSWPSVIELAQEPPSNGLMEKRGGALIDIDRHALIERMKTYYNPKIEWDSPLIKENRLSQDAARYDAKKCRAKLISVETFNIDNVRPYSLRPFDNRWCYYSSIRPLWNEPRPTYWAQCWDENAFFITRPAGGTFFEGIPFYYTSILGDNDFQRGHSYYFPFRLKKRLTEINNSDRQEKMFDNDSASMNIKANLSIKARDYLAELDVGNPDAKAETAGMIWMHALAIGYSETYLKENADGIRHDWPRIPLPANKKALINSADLGSHIAELLDTKKPVEGVTCGNIDPRLKPLGIISKAGGGTLNPDVGELEMNAGWGHFGKNGVCMPGQGRIETRDITDDEQKKHFGVNTYQVYLNEKAYWDNVPPSVWEYTIGGYQVIKKWLSYREKTMLGRSITIEEAEYVTEMVRRIAALILMQQDLDENYKTVKSDTWNWSEGS